MSFLSVGAGILPRYRIAGPVGNVQDSFTGVELHAQELWRADDDSRWRVIICQRGVIWITQERDLQDYVLSAGEMFIVTLPGSVMVQALEDASVQITPPLKATPFVGNYAAFQ